MDVTLHISRIPSTADATRKPLPFAVLEGTDIVLKSQLGPEASVNDHLVWLWGMLKHERRYLKSLAAAGAMMRVQVTGYRGPIEIKPNGAEMLHVGRYAHFRRVNPCRAYSLSSFSSCR